MSLVDPVHTLADLDTWPSSGTWLAVLGHPIKHSISPAMHNAALATLAQTEPRFADWHYVRFDILPDDLPQALGKLRDHNFTGVNLTVPHKMIAFANIPQIDEAARPIGAVNTLQTTEAGWKGFNTDGHGLAAGLREDLGVDLAGADIILLGAGGAARGAAIECLQQGVRSLWIANRTASILDTLLTALKPLAGAQTTLHGFPPKQVPADIPPNAVVINATSAGLKQEDPAPIDLSLLPRPRAVYDMIYNPPQTPLLGQAAALGIPHANGLSMLVYQGAKALSIWTGAPIADLAPSMLSAAKQTMDAMRHAKC